MQNTHGRCKTICAAFAMLILIIDCKTALQGAKEGISICIESVIPALLPMLIISVYLNSRLSDLNLGFLAPIAKPVGIPRGYEGILLISFLGGYPVGAQAISQSYKHREIDKHTAQHLLTFCNNAGPSFIFGVTSALFEQKAYIWGLWIIHILSAYITGLILSGPTIAEYKKTTTPTMHSAISACKNAVPILSTICVWVIFFRVIIFFLDQWILWIFPDWVRILIIGSLELTNGCLKLPHIESLTIRFLLCSILLAFGGLCVLMQTISVISPLKSRTYILGKILQASISILLIIVIQLLSKSFGFTPSNLFLLFVSSFVIIVVCSIYKKTVAKPGKMLYTVLN